MGRRYQEQRARAKRALRALHDNDRKLNAARGFSPWSSKPKKLWYFHPDDVPVGSVRDTCERYVTHLVERNMRSKKFVEEVMRRETHAEYKNLYMGTFVDSAAEIQLEGRRLRPIPTPDTRVEPVIHEVPCHIPERRLRFS